MAMFWADELVKNISGKQVINDSWTPSGIVHMGSLKGPVIHDTLYRVLKEKNADVTFQYGFDDMDPIDGLPANLQATHEQFMGVPIFQAPSPDGNGTFSDYFSHRMQYLLEALDVDATVYRTSELYKNGTFNDAIKFVLDHADGVRAAYSEIYKKQIANTWFPFQVICPSCGKLGTTKVTSWDGKEVGFTCEPHMVEWAQGCGTRGTMSPFDGNGKMPWKVEWAAKWWTFGVTIEGAGKDHGSAGGSYDVAMKILTDVFKKEPPLQLVYEFFLSGGKKMSSSKGLGLTGEELLDVLAPQLARYLMIKTPPNQAVEFTPRGTLIIPQLYDDFSHAVGADEDYLKRSYQLSSIRGKNGFPKVRFLTLAQWVQMPNMEERIKKEGLEGWAKYARVWVERFAPDSEKFTVQKEIPDQVTQLRNVQKQFLHIVAQKIDTAGDAEEFQKQLYEWAKDCELSSKDAFAALYISLLGKNHGPKAGWLILSLDKEFVKKRFEEVAKYSSREEIRQGSSENSSLGENQDLKGGDSGAEVGMAKNTAIGTDIFSLDKTLAMAYPSLSIGIAVIRGVSIKRSDDALDKEKEAVLHSLGNLTTEQLGQYPEIVSYRKLYKATGVDWHSKRPSPEALLRRIALKKGLYSVNTCVDAYNLIVMKHRVSIGAFDLDKIQFPTQLRFAKTGEEILLLGDEQPTQYKEGEIAYFDQEGGFNMHFNYRDAIRTAVQTETTNLYINVDGVFDITPQMVERSLQETCDMITTYCGGTVETLGVVTAA